MGGEAKNAPHILKQPRKGHDEKGLKASKISEES